MTRSAFFGAVASLASSLVFLSIAACAAPSILPVASALALHGTSHPAGSERLSDAWDDAQREFDRAVALYGEEKWLDAARHFITAEQLFENGQAKHAFYLDTFLGARCASLTNALIALQMAGPGKEEMLTQPTTEARGRSARLPDCHLRSDAR